MDIMHLFLSVHHGLHMLCKHSAVFFVDSGHDLLLCIPHMCLRDHKPIQGRLGNFHLIVLEIEHIQVIIHAFRYDLQ